MAGPNDNRRMILDDEMSRFEAEISGPPGFEDMPPENSEDMEQRPIIGSNTFNQVKRQLKQPPVPPLNLLKGTDHQRPNFGMMNSSEMQMRPMGPMDRGSFGPRLPMDFNNGPMRSNMNRPGPFGPDMPPHQGPRNNFMPSHPRHMDPMFNRRDEGGFLPPRMGPPPPSFLPPQLNRAAMNIGNNMRAMMNNVNNMSHVGPGGSGASAFIRPPPPPPNLLNQRIPPKHTISKGPTIFKAAAATISSAPKLYGSQSKETKTEGEDNKNAPIVSSLEPKPASNAETKKKKQKHSDSKSNNPDTSKGQKSKALKMAEQVKQSVTTVTKAPKLQPPQEVIPPPQHQPMPFPPPKPEKERRKSKKNLRYGGGQVWEDTALNEWDRDDFRLFVGDLGNDVTDDFLQRHFAHFASFSKAKVVRDKRTNKTKGYGFVSFKDSQDYIRAMKEMNGKYLGSRPIKLRKSTWKDRNLDVVQKKMKEKQLAGLK